MSAARNKMCGNKDTFYNKERAEKVALLYNQRVYECPICFCYHLTSRQNWQDEFVPAEKYEQMQKENARLGAKLKRMTELVQQMQAKLEKINKGDKTR